MEWGEGEGEGGERGGGEGRGAEVGVGGGEVGRKTLWGEERRGEEEGGQREAGLVRGCVRAWSYWETHFLLS